MKLIKSMIFFCVFIFVSGCSIEQQQILGANSDREDGFSGYGTSSVRMMEGPLMDMMVPDDVPKGRADASKPISEQNVLMSGERNLSWNNQGINRSGSRILSNRPGTLRDKSFLKEKPYLRKPVMIQTLPQGSLEQQIEYQVEKIETVEHAFVVVAGNKTLIGVQSTEPNRHKLRKEVEDTVAGLTDRNNVYIATDRKNVHKIRFLQGARGPIEHFGEEFTGLNGK